MFITSVLKLLNAVELLFYFALFSWINNIYIFLYIITPSFNWSCQINVEK